MNLDENNPTPLEDWCLWGRAIWWSLIEVKGYSWPLAEVCILLSAILVSNKLYRNSVVWTIKVERTHQMKRLEKIPWIKKKTPRIHLTKSENDYYNYFTYVFSEKVIILCELQFVVCEGWSLKCSFHFVLQCSHMVFVSCTLMRNHLEILWWKEEQKLSKLWGMGMRYNTRSCQRKKQWSEKSSGVWGDIVLKSPAKS